MGHPLLAEQSDFPPCRIPLAESKQTPRQTQPDLNQSHQDMTNVEIVKKDASNDAAHPRILQSTQNGQMQLFFFSLGFV